MLDFIFYFFVFYFTFFLLLLVLVFKCDVMVILSHGHVVTIEYSGTFRNNNVI